MRTRRALDVTGAALLLLAAIANLAFAFHLGTLSA